MNPKLVYPDPAPTRSREELEARLAEAERLLREVSDGERLPWCQSVLEFLRIDAYGRPTDSASREADV